MYSYVHILVYQECGACAEFCKVVRIEHACQVYMLVSPWSLVSCIKSVWVIYVDVTTDFQPCQVICKIYGI